MILQSSDLQLHSDFCMLVLSFCFLSFLHHHFSPLVVSLSLLSPFSLCLLCLSHVGNIFSFMLSLSLQAVLGKAAYRW